MQLVVDLGNTQAKIGVFNRDELIANATFHDNYEAGIEQMLVRYPAVSSAIISSVIGQVREIKLLLARLPICLEMNSGLPIPIRNAYATPHTLGNDRLAGAVAGWHLNPQQNTLVIDAGTCIKYDFVAETGTYYGGAISPGIQMRFKALHEYTKQLPLVKVQPHAELIGDSTQTAILSGVLNGAAAEVDGIITAYRQQYTAVQVILTGGDADLLAEKLKNSIFAASFLVLQGLNKILLYNVSTSR